MNDDFAERCYDAGFKEGYHEGYAQAKRDMELAREKKREEDRAKVQQILDASRNPDNKPTNVSMAEFSRRLKRDREALLRKLRGEY